MSAKEEIINRLRRVEGQVRGLARMVEEESPCEDILTQILAARAALDQAALRIIQSSVQHCLPDDAGAEAVRQARQQLQRMLDLLVRM